MVLGKQAEKVVMASGYSAIGSEGVVEVLIGRTEEQNIAAEGSCAQSVVGKVQNRAGTEGERSLGTVHTDYLGREAHAGYADIYWHR